MLAHGASRGRSDGVTWPHGGVLFSLLWVMVSDPLLTTLNYAGAYAQLYGDDVEIVYLRKMNNKSLGQ